MKLGIIIGYLGIGGAERVAANLANWFVKNGDSVVFFNTKKPADKEYQVDASIIRHCCYANSHLKIITKMRIALREEKPDVVLVMSTPMCVYAVPALAGLKIPTVVSERSAPGSAKIKKSTRRISDFLVKYANAYVFQTNGAKSYFSKKIQEKGYVIPNPLVITDLPDPYEGTRSRRFVAIGRLVKEKNYPLLIEAFTSFHEDHPDFVLEIYGDGSEREKLQGIIASSKAEDFITLCGSRSDVLTQVLDAYCFVLSSDLEGMPNALIEAMAIGLPCISTDCPSGGPADLIQNGENGILVPVNDLSAMIIAFHKIIDNPNKANMLGKNATNIRKTLDIDCIAGMWKTVFRSVI